MGGMAKPDERRGVSVDEWGSRLTTYDRVFGPWRSDARRIIDRYQLYSTAGSEKGLPRTADSGSDAGMNVLWSIVNTTKPALFSRLPQIVCERRNKDQDPVGRLAAQVLERAVNTAVEQSGMQDAMDAVVRDVLTIGRGVPWVLFDADPIPPVPVQAMPVLDPVTGAPVPDAPPDYRTEDGTPVDPADVKDTPQGPVYQPDGVTNERLTVDYVVWSDFLHSPHSRNWAEVEKDGWVARRVAMTRKEGVARFGRKFAGVELTMASRMDTRTEGGEAAPHTGPRGSGEPEYAEVYEIWDAVSRRRIHLVRGMDEPLEVQDDPYGLERFFPCPRPSYANAVNDNMIPLPDYRQYEGLADEMDILTRRIAALARSLKVVGIYNESISKLGELLSAPDRTMLGVAGTAQLDGSGGLEKAIQFMPTAEIGQTLAGLYQARDRAQQALYEVSGVSDIVRGQVDPREKAAQSKIKAGYASQRLEQRRRGVERCARDVAVIMAEIMAELYSPDTIREMSGFDMISEVRRLDEPTREQVWQQVVQLIRDDRTRGFRLDVETDSTISMDASLVGEQRNEMLQAVSSFVTGVLPVVAQTVPLFAPAIGQLLLFVIRGHRPGRAVEAEFEQALDAVEQQMQAQQQQAAEAAQQQPQEQPPDPRVEAQAARTVQQTEIDAAQAQQRMQRDAQKARLEGVKGEIDVRAALARLEQQGGIQ